LRRPTIGSMEPVSRREVNAKEKARLIRGKR
jgi:hypothetical protein